MSFLAHAAAHGLLIQDLIADGRWHRCRTEDKPRKRNGSYLFEGSRGVVINWATMTKASVWSEGGKIEQVDRQAIRRMQWANQNEERRRHVEARSLADRMVREATVTTHPYLAAKGFAEETGLVLGGELLIPMREFEAYKQINSIQRIAADGTKLFLAGGKAKGSIFLIGPMMARERWFCEGYATGLSIRAALRKLYREALVVVCFSAGNLAHVGRLNKRAGDYGVADNDKSGAGEEAVMSAGLRYWMSPQQGEDFNDFHLRVGLQGAADSLRQQVLTGGRKAA